MSARGDAARETVNWEGDQPDGGLLHVPWFVDGGLRVTDVWESAEQFNAFVESRLRPGTREVGIEGEPRVEIHPLSAACSRPGSRASRRSPPRAGRRLVAPG